MSEIQRDDKSQNQRAEGTEASEQSSSSLIQALRRHPWIIVFNVMCLAIGLFLALEHLPTEWSLVRRLTAGALSGISIGLVITANRMLGAWR